jgi:phosphoglycolate phosphatase-like HAD superfamily hydrolase
VRYPVVLFDLDGTLVDSAAVILASFHHATETVLRRRVPDEQILAHVGGTNLESQMARLDPERVDELVDELVVGGSVGEGAPELLAGLVYRQVARVAQIKRNELALDLPPV